MHEHRGLAGFDHDECPTTLALLGDQLAGRVRAVVELVGQPVEKLLVGFREERDPANQVAARRRHTPILTRTQSRRLRPIVPIEGRQLALGVTVTNSGTAPAAATIVSAAAPGWKAASADVPSLNGSASTPVTIRLAVPAAAAGTTASFVATVDPARDIPETSYTNNGSSPFPVMIPAAPPKPPLWRT